MPHSECGRKLAVGRAFLSAGRSAEMTDGNVCPTYQLLACLPGPNDNRYWFVTRHFAGRFANYLPGLRLVFAKNWSPNAVYFIWGILGSSCTRPSPCAASFGQLV